MMLNSVAFVRDVSVAFGGCLPVLCKHCYNGMFRLFHCQNLDQLDNILPYFANNSSVGWIGRKVSNQMVHLYKWVK